MHTNCIEWHWCCGIHICVEIVYVWMLATYLFMKWNVIFGIVCPFGWGIIFVLLNCIFVNVGNVTIIKLSNPNPALYDLWSSKHITIHHYILALAMCLATRITSSIVTVTSITIKLKYVVLASISSQHQCQSPIKLNFHQI